MKTVILAAGFGSRLWPLSTPEKPKQFQPLIAGQSLLQYTHKLFSQIADNDEIYVLTLQGLEQLVSEQLPEITPERILCVPERRNTLPHVLYALNSIAAADDEPLLFTTVDHLIVEPEQFISSVKNLAAQRAHDLPSVLLLGNQSQLFDPNAGYFTIDDSQRILSFVEKPSQADMDRLDSSEAHVIKDTAMFVTSKDTFAAALATFTGDASTKGQELLAATPETRTERFLAMPFIDIATGFYEKATNLQADFVAGDFVDLGSFGSLYKVGDKDDQGNVTIGSVITDETSHNNYIVNQLATPLVIIGTSDSVVVQGEAGTVVSPKGSANAVGAIYKSQIYPSSAH
jgi:mannose-1-phosphate guanylyltransferase